MNVAVCVSCFFPPFSCIVFAEKHDSRLRAARPHWEAFREEGASRKLRVHGAGAEGGGHCWLSARWQSASVIQCLGTEVPDAPQCPGQSCRPKNCCNHKGCDCPGSTLLPARGTCLGGASTECGALSPLSARPFAVVLWVSFIRLELIFYSFTKSLWEQYSLSSYMFKNACLLSLYLSDSLAGYKILGPRFPQPR